MSALKHTSGPWKAVEYSNPLHGRHWRVGCGERLFVITEPLTEANARLIAAAPNLASSLQELADAVVQFVEASPKAQIDMPFALALEVAVVEARELLAKATGEEVGS